MGLIPRSRGHVICQVYPEEGRLSWSRTKFSARYRSLNAGNEPLEEG